jgi:RHS repeat-associated protein
VKSAWGYTSRGALAGYTATSGAATLFQTSYIRDSLDRITSVTESVGSDPATTTAFIYGSAGQLFEVRRDGVLTATYEYDLNGNRTRLTTPGGVITGTTDDQDRLTQYGTTTYTYGSNGELKTKTDPGVGTTSYTYDALGNLVAATLPDGTALAYLIDGQNRRVGKRVNGTLVQGFLYQTQLAPVAELDGSQQIVSRFVYGTRANVPDYMVKSGVIYRLISDHLGSVRLVVNTANGTVAQRLDYDEYGRFTQNTAPGFQPFGYAGGLLDNHTGLTRFGARDYDPATGRWTTKDPIGFNGGDPNVYSYVRNDPVNLLDPMGLVPLSECVKALLERYFRGFDLAQIDAQEGLPWYILPGYTGHARGNTIFLDHYDPYSAVGIAHIGHEVTHSVQYEMAGGTLDAWAGYVWEYFKGLSGGSHDEAYQNISLEQLAREKAQYIYNDLKQRFGKANPCPKECSE